MINALPTKKPGIRSELVRYPSRTGQRIAAYIDSPADESQPRRFILMSPKYGETKKNNLQLAYYLAANGFTVVRFDHTAHPGESDGDIVDYTFPGAAEDILATLDYLENELGTDQVTVVASSASVRPAVRAAANDPRVAMLVSVVGVINYRATMEAVYRRDLLGDYLTGAPIGIADILGHQVHVENFMQACIGANMHDLEGSLEDFSKMRGRAFLFFGEQDVWVTPADIRKVVEEVPRVSAQAIDGAMHEIRENPKVAEETVRRVVFVCREGRLPEGDEWKVIKGPDRRNLFRQNRIERERLRKIKPIAGSETDFWKVYLSKFEIVEKVGDYQEYLSAVGGLLGELKASDVVFDCGCGNGLFGVWMLRDLFKRKWGGDEAPVLYVGLDLTEKGLSDALYKHFEAASSLRLPEGANRRAGSTGFFYSAFNLDSLAGGKGRLPFADGTFDKICCSLLISYIEDPTSLMRELHRVLRPGCPVVVSSMKPFCDLSVIYRNFVEGEVDTQDLDSARNLMSAAGAIKLKEEHGQYVFFEKEELGDLARQTGFREIRVGRSFGNQVSLMAGVK